MILVFYKHIPFGEAFIFQGQEYIKGSFRRGQYTEDGRIIFRTFKKKTLVESKINHWDIVPKSNKGGNNNG